MNELKTSHRYIPALGYTNVIEKTDNQYLMYESRTGSIATVPSMCVPRAKRQKEKYIIPPINHEILRVIHLIDTERLSQNSIRPCKDLFNFRVDGFENTFVEIEEGSYKEDYRYTQAKICVKVPFVRLRCKKAFTVSVKCGNTARNIRVKRGEISGRISANNLFGMVKASAPNFWVSENSVLSGSIQSSYVGNGVLVEHSTLVNTIIKCEGALDTQIKLCNVNNSIIRGASRHIGQSRVSHSTVIDSKLIEQSEIFDSVVKHDSRLRYATLVKAELSACRTYYSDLTNTTAKDSEVLNSVCSDTKLNQAEIHGSNISKSIIKGATVHASDITEVLANRIGLVLVNNNIVE